MKRAFPFLLFFFAVCPVFSQATMQKIDSLVRLVNTQSGAERVLTLIQLSEAYRDISIDKSFETGEKAKTYADEAGLENMKGTILLSMGKSASISGDYPLALEYLDKATIAFKESKNHQEHIKTLIQIAIIFKNTAEYEKADQMYNKAISLGKEYGLVEQQAAAESNRGNMFFSLGDYNKAMDSYQMALKIYQNLNDSSRLAVSLTNVGLVYWQWNKNDLALQLLLQAKDIFEAQNNKVELGRAYNNIGKIYHQDIKDTVRALEFYEKSLSIREELGNQLGIAVVLANMGNIYRDRKQFEMAFRLYNRSLAISKAIGYKEGIILVSYYSAIALQMSNRFIESNQLLDSCLTMAKTHRMQSYYGVVNEAKLSNYAALGDYSGFIREFKIFSAGRDSLKVEVDNLKFAELEARNALKIVKDENFSVKQTIQKQEKTILSQRSLIAVLFFAVMIMVILFLSRRKQ